MIFPTMHLKGKEPMRLRGRQYREEGLRDESQTSPGEMIREEDLQTSSGE